jgi:hypothetical protein
MRRTLVQRFVGDVRVVVRSARRPTAEEFDEHLAEAVARDGTTRVVVVAIVGDGADHQFDAEQRAKLSKAGLFSKPHALLAPPLRPEPIVSSRWLGAMIQSFGPDSLEEACDFLEIGASRRLEVRDALTDARQLVESEPPEVAAVGPVRRR